MKQAAEAAVAWVCALIVVALLWPILFLVGLSERFASGRAALRDHEIDACDQWW